MKRIALLYLALFIPVAPVSTDARAASTNRDLISLSFARALAGAATLHVSFHNVTGREQCLPFNWNAFSRLRGFRGGRPLRNRQDYEGRPITGCQLFHPGQDLITVYRLDTMFGAIRPGDRFCYVVPWRPAPTRSLGSTSRCASWR